MLLNRTLDIVLMLEYRMEGRDGMWPAYTSLVLRQQYS